MIAFKLASMSHQLYLKNPEIVQNRYKKMQKKIAENLPKVCPENKNELFLMG